MQKIVNYGEVKITLHSATGWDSLYASVIWQKLDSVLPKAEHWMETGYRRRFGQVCRQTDAVEGVLWSNISHADEASVIANAFEAWMQLPGGLLNAWSEAIDALDEPPGKHELLPPEMLTAEERANPLS